ncbi:SpaH/EbpB family LPXTG-anchored major pilin [Streptococcus suis]|uniref:SpaH/EbpB family LPXTG-anchored major pilin n=1 Tax=Streptococcus suis TaxID=1307 RepID=UPI000CF5D085|nr:SpaH/EbpB family LPXTG-anchored major pilin [Streptococcus suis]MDD7565356.1 SpaH/EbpB family LPXTG-anchored major pilin [Streptococcus suis]MDY5054171.1 SpaH/EbpB family LPXTG-anchored major pilin [Streptococcus suis]HEM4766007.1 SpaH/EbpB family LPXTG-anchored major pilin [Streptococcus suis]HEM4855147.1 SpaH/EbpB family LPXTG-anchored major pilin [Streptococcus suis]HEM5120872.1 SpaH/EbpB family LPXTG-anchored major pilin [Streptococcus suis]
MNKLKSLFMTVLAVLAMVLPTPFASAQEVNTNAGGTGKITVRNASQSQTYELYKLFDATVTEDGSGISYKLPSGKTAQNFGGETWFDVDSKGNITAKPNADVTTPEFATWAKSFGTKVTSSTATDNTLVFTNLTFGYYFVTSSLGAVLTVDSTTPNATVIDKNETNPIIPDSNNGGGKKIVAADGTTTSTTTAKIGDTVPFQFKFNATSFVTANGVTKQINSYTITDTPTALTINQDSVTVKVGTKTLVKDTDYTVAFDGAGKMKVVLTWIKADKSTIYNSPVEVNVAYSAVVTKDAKEGQATNTATLGYNSFDPADPTDPNHPDNPDPDTPDTPVNPKNPDDNTTTVTTHRFTLKKTNEAKATLTGAEFKLYDAANNGTEIKVVKESDGVYRVAQADEQGVAIEAGEVVIKGLKHSTTYYLEEMKAPNGYNILTERQSIEVKENNTAQANIVNKKGGVLPSTGAIGTTLFYLVGSILLLVALVYTISKRRMNNI